MRLGGTAKYLAGVDSKIELQNTIKWVKSHNMPLVTIGGGSNVLFTDKGFDGVVIVNKIEGFETIERDDESVSIRIGAGENWDSVVRKSVEMGLSGIEALSMIPGTAGAAPVQNIGAYGQELADVFVKLVAFDLESDEFVSLDKEQCSFGYRTSIFKDANPRRYVIASITLKLNQTQMNPPFYSSLQEYLTSHSITKFSPGVIREAVIAIRKTKLPDPKILASSGSFFQSPIIERAKFDGLRQQFPDIPGYKLDETTVKIPAGWLVEKAGYKGISDKNGMGTYDKHALVVINNSAKSYQDLESFTEKIVNAVKNQFDITLEREPELITDD